MKNILLGRTGIEVSRAGMGALPIGPNQRNLTVEQGADVIRHAIEKGITLIDTAQFYKTYGHIRRALKGNAGTPVICSKSLAHTALEMKAAVEEARRELDRDVIDIFLLHEVRTGEFEARQGAWSYLQEARAKGLIRACGISTHNVDVTEQMAAVDECEVVFSLINYAGLGIRKGGGTGTAGEMLRAMEKCKDKGKGILAMKAFGGGNLTGEYQRALNYVFSRKEIDSVVIGFAAASEVDNLTDYLAGRMPREYNPDVSQKIMRVEQSDCEGCGRCIKACQSGAVYYNGKGLAEIDRDKCITCGYCAAACPVRALIMY